LSFSRFSRISVKQSARRRAILFSLFQEIKFKNNNENPNPLPCNILNKNHVDHSSSRPWTAPLLKIDFICHRLHRHTLPSSTLN
jgi:hypothetical protein